MKLLKNEVLEFLKKNQKVKQDIADLFVKNNGARFSELAIQMWIKKNDPRLTCISVLEIISNGMGSPIEELTIEV